MIGAAPPHGLAPARLGHGWFADFPDFRCGCKMHYLVHAAFGKAGGKQSFAALLAQYGWLKREELP